MKKTFLVLLILTYTNILYSQKLNIELNPGIGFYSMKSLKEINNETLNQLPFKAKITDNFPPFYYYKLGLVYELKSRFSFGIVGAFNSTGSRINLRDYSGEYKFDQKVSSISPGVTTRLRFIVKKLKIEEYNNCYYSFSRLKMTEYMQVNGEDKSDNLNFIAKIWQAEFGINISYPYRFINIGLSGGYLFDFKSYFELEDNSNAKLARTGWTGLRLGLYASFNIN
jgi:hypothetical protein